MGPRVDFSANALVYDKRHGAVVSDDLAQELTAELAPAARIVEIGAGTGRVAVAMAKLGFEVIGVEPALPMLRAMQEKSRPMPVRCVAADGTALPFADRSAEAVVIARLLYLVKDWQKLLHEAARVATEHGIILHEWGNGTPDENWVRIRERARSLFEGAGVRSPFHPGARTESEVDHVLSDLGFRRTSRVIAGAGPVMSIAEFLEKIESGEVSYTWNVPKEVQKDCLPSLRAWAETQFDMARPIPRATSGPPRAIRGRAGRVVGHTRRSARHLQPSVE